MVELIQTTKYLEDTPTWGKRDYWLYPIDMVILFIEEEEEEEVEEEENGWKNNHSRVRDKPHDFQYAGYCWGWWIYQQYFQLFTSGMQTVFLTICLVMEFSCLLFCDLIASNSLLLCWIYVFGPPVIWSRPWLAH